MLNNYSCEWEGERVRQGLQPVTVTMWMDAPNWNVQNRYSYFFYKTTNRPNFFLVLTSCHTNIANLQAHDTSPRKISSIMNDLLHVACIKHRQYTRPKPSLPACLYILTKFSKRHTQYLLQWEKYTHYFPFCQTQGVGLQKALSVCRSVGPSLFS